MKILVIDDSIINQDAARKQLAKEHDLTVVGSYEGGRELLCGWYEPGPYYNGRYAPGTNHPAGNFDVVLVDLLMPASGRSQSDEGERFVGQEMPIGIFLASPSHTRLKTVLTSQTTLHHSHPASACFDDFNKHEHEPTPFTVEGARVLLSNARGWVCYFQPENLVEVMGYKEAETKPAVLAKHWRRLLEYLLNPPSPTEERVMIG